VVFSKIGCIEGQGYCFGKPLPATAIDPTLLIPGLRKIAG
jgi:EAL domain-containing protein (putative c-di-GMP-specific phosphodiesterase class I)